MQFGCLNPTQLPFLDPLLRELLILVPILEPYLLLLERPGLDGADSRSQIPLYGIVPSAVPPLNVKLARFLTGQQWPFFRKWVL